MNDRDNGQIPDEGRRRLVRALSLGSVLLVSGTAGVGVGRILLSRPVSTEKPFLPEGLVDHFQIGKTTFAFDQEWSQDKRNQIQSDIKKLYWPVSKFVGQEPVDISGRDGVGIAITTKGLGEGIDAQTSRSLNSRRVEIAFSRYTNINLAHELTHACFGFIIGAAYKPAYHIFNEGIPDSIANVLLDSVGTLKERYGQTKFDPNLANKPAAAYYGDLSATGLGDARRLLSVMAISEALRLDPEMLTKFRREISTFFEHKQVPADFFTIAQIRSAIKKSFSGDYDKLMSEHKILGEVTPGKHVAIAGEFREDFGQEVLSAFCFEQSDDGIEESPGVNVHINVSLSVNGKLAWEKQGTSNNKGSLALIKADELGDFKGSALTYKVDAGNFGEDDVTFAA